MSNEHMRSLRDQFQSRFSIDALNMTMSDWICANTTLRGKPFSLAGYEFQRKIIDDMHPNLWCLKCSQVGLALALDTPIPTTSGWTTMGEVQVGDQLYDEAGQPCLVEYVSPIYLDRECFQVEFDDGQTITADGNHRWFVQAHKAFGPGGFWPGKGRPPKGAPYTYDGVITTSQMAELQKFGRRNVFAIPNTQPLEPEGPEGSEELPLDPYYLGLWLGDGHAYSTRLTGVRTDIASVQVELEKRGMDCLVLEYPNSGLACDLKVDFPRDRNGHHDTVYSRLRKLNLLENKHVPQIYLRASKEARRDLLQGLMDTDGSVTQGGRSSFYNTNSLLVSAVEELVASLGYKFRTRWRKPSSGTLKTGQVINPRRLIAEVSFVAYAEAPVFKLPRKVERLRRQIDCRSTESLRRRVVSVTKTPTVPVRCISVDSPSHLFLAGRGMIPTHNTEVQIRKVLAFLERNQGTTGIFTLPTQPMRDRLAKTRVKPLVDNDAVFNKERDKNSTRTSLLYQVGHSFLHLSDCTEGAATSTPADILGVDEIDLADQKMVALFGSRLQNSNFKIKQHFSTPTHVSYGVDAGFSASDQHEYLCRCPACGHHNIPDFTRAFVNLPGMPDDLAELTDLEEHHVAALNLDGAFVRCEKCQRALDLGDSSLREWVPLYPTKTLARGYRVRPFCTDRLTIPYIIGELLTYRRNDYIRGFFNTVLGKAYTGGNDRLTYADIEACMDSPAIPDLPAGTAISVGIDSGIMCHVTIFLGADPHTSPVVQMLVVHSEKLVEFIAQLAAKFNIVTGGMDRHPQTVLANQVREASGNKIWPIEYRGTKNLHPVKDVTGEEVVHFQADRTALLDRVASRVRGRNLKMSGYLTQKQVVANHLTNMVRDEKPEEPARWLKLSEDDHYFHALGMGLTSMHIESYISGIDDAYAQKVTTIFGVNTAQLGGLLSAKPSLASGPLG